MTTKTIIAVDMQHAMSQAKKELGSDAIIVSSRRVGDEIEVTVTDDLNILETAKPKIQSVKAEARSLLPQEPLFEEQQPAEQTAEAQQLQAQADKEQLAKEPLAKEPLARDPLPKDPLPKDPQLKEKAQLIEFPVEKPAQNGEEASRPASTSTAMSESADPSAVQSLSPTEGVPSFLESLKQAQIPPGAEDNTLSEAAAMANNGQPMVDASRFSFDALQDPALKRLIGELKSIGEFWNEFGVYWESHADSFQYPWSKQLRDRIDYLHLSHDLRDRLVREHKEISEFEKSWQLVLSGLQQQINISSSDIVRTGGAYAFVGPSGAGKTTTIGKIAAEYVLQHGADEVGLITTDIFRIAAYEQLTTMGKILDVELEVVDAQQGGLVDALERFSSKSLVLIDTAGLRRNDRDLAQQLVQIRQQGQRLQTMLVLPANLQYQSMVEAMETYETDDYQGCIFTRLDECNSMGAAVSLLVNTGIPAAYLGSGHTIPDDLARATSLLIIEQLLSFACQEVDVSRVGTGKITGNFSPEQDRQIDLI